MCSISFQNLLPLVVVADRNKYFQNLNLILVEEESTGKDKRKSIPEQLDYQKFLFILKCFRLENIIQL